MSFSLANQSIGTYSQYSPLITNTLGIEKSWSVNICFSDFEDVKTQNSGSVGSFLPLHESLRKEPSFRIQIRQPLSLPLGLFDGNRWAWLDKPHHVFLFWLQHLLKRNLLTPVKCVGLTWQLFHSLMWTLGNFFSRYSFKVPSKWATKLRYFTRSSTGEAEIGVELLCDVCGFFFFEWMKVLAISLPQIIFLNSCKNWSAGAVTAAWRHNFHHTQNLGFNHGVMLSTVPVKGCCQRGSYVFNAERSLPASGLLLAYNSPQIGALELSMALSDRFPHCCNAD